MKVEAWVPSNEAIGWAAEMVSANGVDVVFRILHFVVPAREDRLAGHEAPSHLLSVLTKDPEHPSLTGLARRRIQREAVLVVSLQGVWLLIMTL